MKLSFTELIIKSSQSRQKNTTCTSFFPLSSQFERRRSFNISCIWARHGACTKQVCLWEGQNSDDFFTAEIVQLFTKFLFLFSFFRRFRIVIDLTSLLFNLKPVSSRSDRVYVSLFASVSVFQSLFLFPKSSSCTVRGAKKTSNSLNGSLFWIYSWNFPIQTLKIYWLLNKDFELLTNRVKARTGFPDFPRSIL